MSSLPKLNQLINLRAVIRYGSIRAAADATHQTQSAMTRSIQELEKNLCVTLLNRNSRGVLLTEIGLMFEPRMNMILNELERAVDEIQQTDSASHGFVRFGCSHLPAMSVMPKLLKNFQQRYPLTNLTVIEGQLSELLNPLRTGQIDFFIGIITSDISLHEFNENFLTAVDFGVFCSEDNPLRKSRSLDELCNAKWYLPTASAGFFSRIESLILCGKRGADFSVLFGNSTSIAEQLIINEGYFSIGPISMVSLPHLKGKLTIVPISEPIPKGRYGIIYRDRQSLTPSARLFMSEVRYAFIN
jgi:LysR family transcriptional regulator of abg operon